MARRRLFSDEHWAGLFALPTDERDVVRHCTLTADDLALIGIVTLNDGTVIRRDQLMLEG